jgi:GT2 family glycosyltransferase
VQADVAAVIVAYNSGAADLQRAVALLLESPWLAELLIVDNASTDGCTAALLAHADPRVRVLRQHENLGFGRAMNLGVAASQAPWLLLVNPDCELPPTALARLREQAGAAELAPLGVLSAQLCFADGRLEPASLRLDPTPLRVLIQLSGLWRMGLQGIWQRPHAGLNEVQACSGALMLLPRAAFAAVQGFDPGYFLHAEDLDLCRRLRGAGLRVWVDADLRVLHHKGGSSAQRLTVLRHKQRGLLRYFEQHEARHCGVLGSACIRGIAKLLFAVQALILRLRGQR